QLALRPAEELGVVRVGPRPAPFDVGDAEVVEVPGDGQLVRDREVDPLLLRAVAHRRVVDVERRAHLLLPDGTGVRRGGVTRSSRRGRAVGGPGLPFAVSGTLLCPTKRKTPRVREVCATSGARR